VDGSGRFGEQLGWKQVQSLLKKVSKRRRRFFGHIPDMVNSVLPHIAINSAVD